MTVKIFACGDTYLSNKARDPFSSALRDAISKADVAVCNFEGPVKSNGSRIAKVGAHLEQSEAAVRILRDSGFGMFCLANNHISDYGAVGVEKTLEEISHAGACGLGAGMSFQEAYKPVIREIDGFQIGFMAFCEADFGVLSAENGIYGYAWINHPLLEEMVRECKKKVDRLIVFVHSGAESVPLPLTEWRERYKIICDVGADVIVGHHPHVPQGYEKHGNSFIFYSLGNMFFDYAEHNAINRISYSIMLEMDQREISFKVLPHGVRKGKVVLLDNGTMQAYVKKLNLVLNADYEVLSVQQAAYLYRTRYVKYHLGDIRSTMNSLIAGLIHPARYKNKRALYVLHNLKIESHRYAALRGAEAAIRNKNIDTKMFEDMLFEYAKMVHAVSN